MLVYRTGKSLIGWDYAGGDQCWSPAGLNMIIKLCVNQEGNRIRVGTAFLGVHQATFPTSYQPGTLINQEPKQSACKSKGMKGFDKEEEGKEREWEQPSQKINFFVMISSEN